MSKILQLFGALGLILLSTSCGGMYQNPPKDLTKVSLLRNENNRLGLYTWQNSTVEAIDDKAINYMTSLTTTTKEIVVSGGNHNVVIGYAFNRGFGNGPYEARCDINMDFNPGIEYVAKGKIDGSQVAFWIENSRTSRPASKIVKVPYSRMVVNNTVPIFIPSN